MSDVSRVCFDLGQLIQLRNEYLGLLKQASIYNVRSDSFDKSVSTKLSQIDNQIKKYLAPVEGVPQVVRVGYGYYTWIEHSNISWNGLRCIVIQDGEKVKLDHEFRTV